MPKVRITATSWAKPLKDGGRQQYYKGNVVDVTAAEAKRLVGIGAAVAVKEPKPEPEPAPETEPDAEPESVEETSQDEVKRPAKSGVKEAWVAYAVAQGMDAAEAESKTRDELVAHYT